MKERKPKSPILVFATMLFLLMFIVLPPLFRSLFPVEVVVEEVKQTKKDYMLTCIKNSTSENLRAMSKISYVNNLPVSNTIIYTSYVASSEENVQKEDSESVLTIAEELALFRDVEGVLINDENNSVKVSITKEVIDSNSDNLEFANFLLQNVDKQKKYYEGQGYACIVR